MTTEQYETHRYGNSAFVVALSWYAVFTLLCHSAIILIVPKLSVNVLHTPWYKHSTALRYAMMVWILHWIIEFIEAFAKSNYFTYATNYLIICTIRSKFQSVMFALTTIMTFLCWISILEDCFKSTALQYSSKTIWLLKIFICIPMIFLCTALFFALEPKIYAVKDDATLLFCATDPTGNTRYITVLTVFGSWYLLTEIVALYMFLSKMHKVK